MLILWTGRRKKSKDCLRFFAVKNGGSQSSQRARSKYHNQRGFCRVYYNSFLPSSSSIIFQHNSWLFVQFEPGKFTLFPNVSYNLFNIFRAIFMTKFYGSCFVYSEDEKLEEFMEVEQTKYILWLCLLYYTK